MKLTLAMGMLLTVTASGLSAESLADVARRERARREEARKSGVAVRVVDGEALAAQTNTRGTFNVGTTGEASTNPSTEAAARGITEVETPVHVGEAALVDPSFPTDVPGRTGAERLWRARARQAQARVDAARKRRAASPASSSGPKRTVVKLACGRIQVYVNAEEELRVAEQELMALEEEARRASIPPGWLR